MRFYCFIVLLFYCCWVLAANGQPIITVSWDANDEEDLEGYRVYIGESSRNYTGVVEAGNLTEFKWLNLSWDKEYFFAVTAYDFAGNESDFSEEVSIIASQDSSEGFELRLAIHGQGRVARSPLKAFYAAGDVVDLEAIPSEGWLFDSWSGDGVTLIDSTRRVFFTDQDVNVQVQFDEIPAERNLMAPRFWIETDSTKNDTAFIIHEETISFLLSQEAKYSDDSHLDLSRLTHAIIQIWNSGWVDRISYTIGTQASERTLRLLPGAHRFRAFTMTENEISDFSIERILILISDEPLVISIPVSVQFQE